MLNQRRRRGRPIHVVFWLGLSAATLVADYFIGPVIQFPALFIVPVSIAAWYSGRVWGLLLAVILPLGRLYLTTIADPPWSLAESSINAAIRIAVLGAFAWLIDRSAVQSEALSRRVGLLEGLYPLCAVCKKVRSEGNRWEALEDYVLSREKDRLAPEVCPECARLHGESAARR